MSVPPINTAIESKQDANIIKELSALDLRFILEEMNFINKAKIENIYQDNSTFYFHLYCASLKEESKQILVINLPSFLYTTQSKVEMPLHPPDFCMLCRKFLKGGSIQTIIQHGFQRIIELIIKKKDTEYKIIIELYGTGNILICNTDYKIIYTFRTIKEKERTIKAGIPYSIPNKGFNPDTITVKELEEFQNSTPMQSIVTFLAKDCGFGGKYAEQLCNDIKIDKKTPPKDIKTLILYEGIKKIINKPHQLLKDLEKQQRSENTISEKTVDKKESQKSTRIQKIISMQQDSLNKYTAEYLEAQNIGERIYLEYSLLQQILTEVKSIKKDEIENILPEIIKKYPSIKAIEYKKGELTLDL